jgi:hypothetical protein
MKIKASGRSALILAAGMWMCFVGPLYAAPATGSAAATPTTATPVALNKSAKHASRHWKKYAHHKSGEVVQTSSVDNKAAATEVADADKPATLQSEIPSSVANANAKMTASDQPASDASATDAAKAMSVRAATILQNAPDNPAAAQPAAETLVVAADQLNDVDRALRPGEPPATTLAVASAEPPVGTGSAVSSSDSTWDQTSLIGKIFVGFGALLTMASAARMFMA